MPPCFDQLAKIYPIYIGKLYCEVKLNHSSYAIKIETGSIFSKIERMKEKLEVLKDYDGWFFVVTDRNKVKKYKKYDDAVDKRYVKQRLDKLVKLAKKAQK